MTPTKEEIERRAREIYARDCYRKGNPELADTNPEIGELRENGYLNVARSELMTNTETKNEQWLKDSESVETKFLFDTSEAMQTTSFISGSRGIGKSDVAMYQAEQLMKQGIVIAVFDPSCDWLKRSSIQRYFTVKPYSNLPIPENSTIFDVSQLTPNQTQQCLEQFCKKLFDFQISNSAKRFYVVFEEAQIYFPLSALSSKKTQNTMRALTVGRNVNISMCAISQFPALISKELIKNAQQLWIGCCAEPNTLAYWKGILGKKAEELKKLQNGQFVYYCRNKISLTKIEPYESDVSKTQIQIPEPAQPIRTNQNISVIPVAKLFILLGFAVLVLSSLRGM